MSKPRSDESQAVLVVHNRYRQRGGEDVAFEAEASLLEERGHRVRRFVVDNARLPASLSVKRQLRLAANTLWSRAAATAIRQAITEFRPDVVHVHNPFPQLSPSIYEASTAAGVPVVQTLHNYRFICPAATLYRDGGPCEDCVGRKVAWPGVIHACYQESHLRSSVVAGTLLTQRARGGWDRVAAFIALSEFGRRMFVRGGLPADRIVVKPNFVEPASTPRATARQGYLYVGRLAAEKGILTLLRAWRTLPGEVELRVIGDGPLRHEVEAAASTSASIRFDGPRERAEVAQAMSQARALVFPSEWYEGCPMTLIEAFASGLPVIGSRLGSVEEMVHDGRTGLLFTAANADDLAAKVRWADRHVAQLAAMGDAAREEHRARYTPGRSYEQLARIYRGVTH